MKSLILIFSLFYPKTAMALLSLGTCTFSSPSRLAFSPIHSQSHSLNSPFSGFSLILASPVSISISAPSTPLPVLCGRGDKKTKKGKRFKHSYGNSRLRDPSKGTGAARAPTPPNPYKKKIVEEFDDSDIVDDDKPIPDFE